MPTPDLARAAHFPGIAQLSKRFATAFKFVATKSSCIRPLQPLLYPSPHSHKLLSEIVERKAATKKSLAQEVRQKIDISERRSKV